MDTLNNWIPRTAHSIIVWFLFFLICTGLGYAALKRYDPRTTVGMTDVHAYYRMVQGEPLTRPRADVFAGRILVPFLARPFYRLLRRFDGSFDPVLLALLIVNSAFCATAAFLLVQVTTLLRFDFPVGLVFCRLGGVREWADPSSVRDVKKSSSLPQFREKFLIQSCL